MENENYRPSNPSSPAEEQIPLDSAALATEEMDEEAAVKERLTSDDPTKVKFISANNSELSARSKNGDAKVDIENVQRCVGMGKEELMKYANDPFWVRLRMTLFVLFWFVWVAMLVGSVVIIIIAPRCPPPPQLDWWQKSAVYQVMVGSYKDSNGDGHGDLQGLASKLGYLEQNKLNTLLLGPVFPATEPNYGQDIHDFIDIAPEFGTMEDFSDLVTEMDAKDMKLLLELVPNHSSLKHPWFLKSVKRQAPYTDYYIWADGKQSKTDNKLEPPNNWVSVHGGPAWTFHAERKQYYLSQFHQNIADLNLRLPEVRVEIKNIMKFWLDKGVDGFKISHVAHLVEDDGLRDEAKKANITGLTKEYDQFYHNLTLDQPMNFELLEEWREFIDSYSTNNETASSHKRLLLTDTSLTSNSFNYAYYGNSSSPLSDIPFNAVLLDVPQQNEAKFVGDAISAALKGVPDGLWPNWVLGTTDQKRLASRVGPSFVDAFHAITLLAKGTPILYYGDEIGMENVTIPDHLILDPVAILSGDDHHRDPMKTPMQWDNSSNAGFTSGDTAFLPISKDFRILNVLYEAAETHSHLKIFQRLMALRETPSIGFGTMEIKSLKENIFTMLRVRKGNPGYLIVVNFSKEDHKHIDLTKLSTQLPENGKVELATSSPSEIALNDAGHPTATLSDISIAAKQTAVISFVPKAS